MPPQDSETDAIAISPALTGLAVLFDGFRLEEDGALWHADGTTALLGSRALDVLRVLVGRAGQLVPKREIMDAVWPGVAVEEGNLTVQVSALRKVIDAGRPGPSCIHTVPGRGYRFVLPVTPIGSAGHAAAVVAAPPLEARPESSQPDRPVARGAGGRFGKLVFAAVLAVFLAITWYVAERWTRAPQTKLPRLSLVVLPFENTGGDPADNYLADAITDDLTSDLSHIPGAKVIARASARLYQGKPVDPRIVGRELDVRYVLSGSVRRVGDGLRVNAELVSAETGEQIWSDRFEKDIRDLNAGQHEIIVRIRGPLRIRMVDYESMRSARERPTNPDAFDLVLRGRFLWENQRYSREARDRGRRAVRARIATRSVVCPGHGRRGARVARAGQRRPRRRRHPGPCRDADRTGSRHRSQPRDRVGGERVPAPDQGTLGGSRLCGAEADRHVSEQHLWLPPTRERQTLRWTAGRGDCPVRGCGASRPA